MKHFSFKNSTRVPSNHKNDKNQLRCAFKGSVARQEKKHEQKAAKALACLIYIVFIVSQQPSTHLLIHSPKVNKHHLIMPLPAVFHSIVILFTRQSRQIENLLKMLNIQNSSGKLDKCKLHNQLQSFDWISINRGRTKVIF